MSAVFRSAVVASVLAAVAVAQVPQQPLSCATSIESVPFVRSEGQAELVGDLLIVCTGGLPTPAGDRLRVVDFSVFSQPAVNITSKVTYAQPFGDFAEALLLVDEPAPAKQTICGSPAYPYSARAGDIVLTGSCADHPASPKGDGIGTYDPDTGPSRGNVYQARLASRTVLFWRSIPFDPPGAGGTRILRVTNVRVNVSEMLVPAGSTVRLNLLTSFGSRLGPPISIPIANSAQVVAIVQHSVRPSVIRQPGPCLACESANRAFGEDSSQPLGNSSRCDGRPFKFRFEELESAAFRQRAAGLDPANPQSQDRLGVPRLTESGFYKREPNGDRWPERLADPNNASVIAGLGSGVGLADTGTRFTVAFSNVPEGVRIWLPPAVNVISGIQITGIAVSLMADSQVAIENGRGAAYFTIHRTDPTRLEAIEIEPVISYATTSGTGVSNVSIGLGAADDFPRASTVATVPRFVTSATTPQPWLEIAACRTILLFPWVTHNGNTDTGLAIVNASLDPFTSEPDAGRCAIHYFGAAGTITAESPAIAGGEHFAWTLGGGGALPAVPGFAGYVIADCALRSAYGFAFIADPAGLRSGTAYLGLTLNDPLRTRTGAIGERLAH